MNQYFQYELRKYLLHLIIIEQKNFTFIKGNYVAFPKNVWNSICELENNFPDSICLEEVIEDK